MLVANAELLQQLSAASARYRDPVAEIDWHALDTDSFWLPESALSLYGLPEYDGFPTSLRRRLSQYEFINVLCCGLWLESVLLQRLARELNPGMRHGEYEYVLHQLREETGHSLMFLKAIETSRLPFPDGAWRCPKLSGALARWAPVRGSLFWLAMVIGEHVPDAFNRWLRGQQGVHPVVEQICRVHVVDEARHIACARNVFEMRRGESDAARKAVLRVAARVLLHQLARMLYFPPACFYELAGLPDGRAWRRRALGSEARRRFVESRLVPTASMLASYGAFSPAGI